MLEVAKHPSPPGNRRPTMTEGYDGRQVVGMDLHRRRSVLVRMTGDGRKLETVRIENSPRALRAVLARAGKNPRVVVEATYGWYWAADVLEEAGAEVHLAHPLGVKAFTYRRVKDDERDAADLAVPRIPSLRWEAVVGGEPVGGVLDAPADRGIGQGTERCAGAGCCRARSTGR